MENAINPLRIDIVSQSIWLDPPKTELKSTEYAAACVEGDLQITLRDVVVVERPHFTIFELVYSFERWRASPDHVDFVFTSFNDEHGEFIRISADGDDLNFGVRWPEDWKDVQVTRTELLHVLDRLRECMFTKAQNDLGIDLNMFLPD